MPTTATRKFALGVGAIIALTIALYVPSLRGQFLMDDFDYVAENVAVTHGAPLADYFFNRDTTAKRLDFRWQSYRPVRTVGFRVLAATFGPRPLPFKVANLTLYALAIVLFSLLARRLCGDDTAALVATALWALMPVHVEPVVYVSALGDHLSLVFQLASFMCVAVAVADSTRSPLRVWLLGLASLVLAALALGAKEMAVTESGILVLAAACTWRRLDVPARRRVTALVIAHGLLTLGFLLLRTHVIRTVGQGQITWLTARVAVRAAPICLWNYLYIVLAPIGHAAAYAAPRLSRWHAALAWAGIVAVALVSWRLRRPALSFALGWFALSLLPVLHLVPLLAYYADRFALVPSIGIALAVAVLLTMSRGRARQLLLVLAGAVLLLDAAGVLLESRAWRDDDTLWRYTVEAQPEASLAHMNLAIAELKKGLPAEALTHLEATRRIGGDGPIISLDRAVALDMLGRDREAEQAVGVSLAYEPRNEAAHALRGSLLLRRGAVDEAALELARARRLAPDAPPVLMLAGQVAEARHDAAGAQASYRRAVELAPNSPRYRYAWARSALAAGQTGVAVEVARACVAADPARPDCAAVLGRALAALHDPAARPLLERAMATLPAGAEREACLKALQNL